MRRGRRKGGNWVQVARKATEEVCGRKGKDTRMGQKAGNEL